MADTPISFHIAQAIGITASAFLSGATIALSFYTVPSLLLAPTPLLLRQWRAIYNRGKVTGPPIGMLSGLSYAYLAYQTYYNSPTSLLSTSASGGSNIGGLYVIATLLAFSNGPFTLAFMAGTNSKLLQQCEEMEGLDVGEEVEVKSKRESARQLMDWWAKLNLLRGFGPLVAALLGVWASSR
ncbi:MAG: hypothetical protein M1812_004325 [Candelaria pacifica]|nr:MAG: hypothetical protein M1812_004325 [Candelaria pacifica]